MNRLMILLAILIALIPIQNPAMAFRSINFTNGSCWDNPNLTDWIGLNLADYFCVIGYELQDSTEMQNTLIGIGKAIKEAYPEAPELHGQNYYLQYIYAFENHENLVFFGIPNPVSVHGGLHIVYNIALNRYFVLPRITVPQLDTLLSTEQFYAIDTSMSALEYCIFVSSLMNPCCPLKILAHRNDLKLIGMLKGAFPDDLAKYKDIVIEPPLISTNGDAIEITYYIAVSNYIEKVDVVLRGWRIYKYNETEISKIPGLLGPSPY
jgi:hypothetical protein